MMMMKKDGRAGSVSWRLTGTLDQSSSHCMKSWDIQLTGVFSHCLGDYSQYGVFGRAHVHTASVIQKHRNIAVMVVFWSLRYVCIFPAWNCVGAWHLQTDFSIQTGICVWDNSSFNPLNTQTCTFPDWNELKLKLSPESFSWVLLWFRQNTSWKLQVLQELQTV